jgi:hypothetical protein
MSDTVIRDAARALNPDKPIKTLAGLRRSPRSTAKSWATGRRRSPAVILRILLDLLKDRQAVISGVVYQLNHDIAQRERETRRRTGFFVVDPATGRNRQNRAGRLKRKLEGR